MRQTIRLGRIAGIPVGVHWSVLVIMVLLVQSLAMAVLPASVPESSASANWAVAVVVAIVFLASLLAHELAHSLVARHYGVRVRRITLWLLGGVAELDGEAPHARGDLLIALAGPATSLGAAGLFFGAALLASGLGLSSLAVASLAWLAFVNAILAVFNLLPGAPLDGGRVLRAILWRMSGDRKAAAYRASQAGVGLGILLALAGVAEVLLTNNISGLWFVLLGWFLVSAASAERLSAATDSALQGVTVGDVMALRPVCVYSGQTVADFIAVVGQHAPYRTFPVLTPDGQLAGIVGLERLTRVPPAQRGTTRMADIMVPVSRIAVLAPSTPLFEAATSVLGEPGRLVPVVDDGRLLGVLSSGDVARAIQLSSLGVLSRRDAHSA